MKSLRQVADFDLDGFCEVSRAVEIYIQRNKPSVCTTVRRPQRYAFLPGGWNVSLSPSANANISFLTDHAHKQQHVASQVQNAQEFSTVLEVPRKVKRLRMPFLARPRRGLSSYIYSCAELKRMLRATSLSQRSRNVGAVDSSTFRTFLLFLYGTAFS